MSETQNQWIGRTLGGRYQIDSLLGRGGMSAVFKATDPNLQRTVAIKLIHPHLSENPEFVKRFEQEAAAVAQLRHPNIMQVHDFNHEGGVYYIVFEYIPGESLKKRLADLTEANLRLPLAETIRIMVALCGAVAYAHERNMIHRDLKPSNVMLNLLGEPILLDFGIAKIVGSDHVQTATGATIGTATYMSPEQAKSAHVDHRADIYSLGIMLYEMAAGRPPFEGESALTVMLKHMQEPLPDIRQLNQNVPDALIAILENALVKNPDQRFRSAMHMASALQTVIRESSGPAATRTYTTTQAVPMEPEPAAAIMADPKPAPVSPVASEPTPGLIDPQPVAIKPATPTSRPPSSTGLAPAVSPPGSATRATPAEIPVPKSAAEPSARPARQWSSLILRAAAAVLILAAVSLGAYFLIFRRQLPSSEGMVSIPAGTYTVGNDNNASQYAPLQQLELSEYWIDQFEVTNAQYAAFLDDTEAQPPLHWTEGVASGGQRNHPVQGVTWDMAVAYCQWAHKRLPTEAEWEVAARGPLGFRYPWGNSEEFLPLTQSGTHEVGTVLVNRSEFGAYDMAGNVWEWVGETYASVPGGQRMLRGGAYDFQKDMAYRLLGNPDVPTMVATAGFRCSADSVEVVPDPDLLLEDKFTDPESGWATLEEGSVKFGYHPPDYYHVQSGQANFMTTAFLGGSFDNIHMASDVFVDSTDTDSGDFRYGLVLRREGDRFYAFTISPRARVWHVLKSTSTGLQVLAQGSDPSIHEMTSSSRLRVDASGSAFVFSIDGHVVSQLTDADYVAGDIGFLVETFDETRVHVHYDSLTVHAIENVPFSTVRLLDDFGDPNSGWPSVAEGSLLSGYHPPDYYHLQSGEPNHRSLAFFDRNFDDLVVETAVFVENTSTEEGDFLYGVAVRRQGEQYYGFLISPRTGAWQVIKNSATGQEVLAQGSDDTIQGLTEADALQVEAAGNNLAFHINGHVVVRLNDGEYRSGSVGFIVQTLDESRAHIHYDFIRIR